MQVVFVLLHENVLAKVYNDLDVALPASYTALSRAVSEAKKQLRVTNGSPSVRGRLMNACGGLWL